METVQRLNRMPDTAGGEEMMGFLLDQQDAVTGAFMDRSDPAFSFFAPTINVVDALAGLSRDTGRPLARGVMKLLDTLTPEGTTDQHDWGLKQYQGAKMLTRLLWPYLAASEKDEVRRKFRSMLVQSYSLYRPDDGVLPGTLERERLWGSASEATLTPVHARIERWEQATLPRISEVQSSRIYQDLLSSAGAYDLARIAREHLQAKRFYVLAYDIAQTPIQAIEFTNSGRSLAD